MALVPMQTMNLQLETYALNYTSDKTSFQGESSFSKMLESASNAYTQKEASIENESREVSSSYTYDDKSSLNDTRETQRTDEKPEATNNEIEKTQIDKDDRVVEDKDTTTANSEGKENSVQNEESTSSEKKILNQSEVVLNLNVDQDEEKIEINDVNISFLESSVKEDEIVEETIDLEESLKVNDKENETLNEDQSVIFAMLTGQEIKETNIATDDAEINITEPIVFSKDKNIKTDKPIIQVIDERTVNQDDVKKSDFVTTVEYDGNGNAEMNMSLAKGTVEMSQVASSEGKITSETFSQMLSNELKQNASEFVKTGSIVLKDGNKGTINLVLHPEELGNVKIQLELSEKLISAKIVVGSEEAYNAFKSSLNTLKEAFAFSGFEDGGFDLSWSNDNSGNGRDNQNNPKGQMYETVLNSFNNGVEDDYGVALAHDAILYGSSLVNMVV